MGGSKPGVSAVARARSAVRRWGSIEARSERIGEGKERSATVGIDARSERSGVGKERSVAVGIDGRSEIHCSREGKERRGPPPR